MRSLGFLALLVLAEAAPVLVKASGGGPTAFTGSTLIYNTVIKAHEDIAAVKSSRKLKKMESRKDKIFSPLVIEDDEDLHSLGTSYVFHTSENMGGLGKIDMEDYPRFDPAPSTRATIKAGPIEHGTPLMPYIPWQTPPSHPKHGSP